MTFRMVTQETITCVTRSCPIHHWLDNAEYEFLVRYYDTNMPNTFWQLSLLPDGKVVCKKDNEEATLPHGYWEREFDTSLTIQWNQHGIVYPDTAPEHFLLIKGTSVYRHVSEYPIRMLLPVSRPPPGPYYENRRP